MQKQPRISTVLLAGHLALLLAALLAVPAWAQEKNEKEKEPEWLQTTKPEDPAVQAVLETNPTTPAELVRAAKILADLKHPDVAKPLLDKVLKANLDQSRLAALADRYGTALFSEMAARESLQPEAKALADAVLTAHQKQLTDPQRLAALVKQLGDASEEKRFKARAGLREAGSAAVGPLVDALADPARAAERKNVRAALVALGADATRPLIGLLEADDPNVVVQAIETLAASGARESTLFLLAPMASRTCPEKVRDAAAAALAKLLGHAPTQAEATRVLAERARRYYDRKQPMAADADGNVVVWTWDPAKKRCVPKTSPEAAAARAMAPRLARAAHDAAPNDERILLTYLGGALEKAAYDNGLEKPLSPESAPVAEAAAHGVDTVEALLEDALATDHPPVATVAAGILGRVGKAERLLRRQGRAAPLVRAAQHPDRRLRMAAVDAILKLRATEPFVGASVVPEALRYFAAANGTRRVLLAGPNTTWLQEPARLLAKAGYKVETVVQGREVIRQALASPDYELIFMDAALARPAVDLLLQQLRRDARTATLPVGILARDGDLPRARRFARRDPLAEAFSRPHDEKAVRWQLDRLETLRKCPKVSRAERMAQATAALDWLARLAGEEQNVYDVRRDEPAVLAALRVPALGAKAVAVLANLGTPDSQTALVDAASRWTQPLALRQAAAEAFAQNVRKHGVLLTTSEIQRQYDRYNQSETQDRETQKVLGSILDVLETSAKTNRTNEEKEAEGA